MGKSGNVSLGGGVHSFAVSYLETVSGEVKASDLGVPYFYVCPLVEEAITVLPLNNDEEVTLPQEMISLNVGVFLPVQCVKANFTSSHIIGL